MPQVERDLRLEEYERERTTCPDCGNPVEKCSDPFKTWYPYRRICYATMGRAAAEAAYREIHKDAQWHNGSFTSWAKEWSPEHPVPLDNSGVTIGVSEHVTPDDKFTTDPEACPWAAPDEDDSGD